MSYEKIGKDVMGKKGVTKSESSMDRGGAHKEMHKHHKEMVKHHERELKHHEKKMKEHEKSKKKVMHSDEREDKSLIRKMVKKSAIK